MEKDINKYLNDLAGNFPKYNLSADDSKQIQRQGLDFYIFNKVLSHKYRKTSITDGFKDKILKNVRENIKNNKPIRFTIPTGGYKKWQFTDIAPEIDWSEFFHLRYMVEYLAPITSVYKQGVLLEYFSNSWLIKIISHYPHEDLDKYTESFRELIAVFSKMLPNNFVIKYNVVADQISETELLTRISNNKQKVEEEYSNLNDVELKELYKYSERNIRWDILEQENKLTEVEKKKIIREGKVIHDSLLKGGWNSDLYYLRNDNAIPIIHRKSHDEFLHIASTQGAYVQFWVGKGILELRNEKFIPRILSFDQYQQIKGKAIKINVKGFKIKNLNKLEVIKN